MIQRLTGRDDRGTKAPPTLLERPVNLQQPEHADEESDDREGGRPQDHGRDHVHLLPAVRKGRRVREIRRLFARLLRSRLDFARVGQGLLLAGRVR